MLSTRLPGLETLNAGTPVLEDNQVIYARSDTDYDYPEHPTPYLFIGNYSGRGEYMLNNKPVTVWDPCFYLLNAHDRLAIHYSKKEPLQTLFILFREEFFTRCLHVSRANEELLLDDPDQETTGPGQLPAVPIGYSALARKQITRLLQPSLANDEMTILLAELVTEFGRLGRQAGRQMEKIKAVKKSTREEIYRRLFLATTIMQDRVRERLSLDQLAKAVCMDKFHFLSRFKSVYYCTPHRFYTELKLREAYRLLEQEQQPVSEVCHLLGFESLASFSHLFRKRFSIAPSSLLKP